MRKALRVVGWIIAVLIAVVALLAVAAHLLSQRKLDRRIDVKVVPVAYVDSPAALERGKYLFESRGCADCHGSNGAGRVFSEGDESVRLKSPNITRGPGSVVANYKEVDWVRAIRHGVKPDGRPMLIMPSEEYNRLTDTDLAAIVAYTRQLPSVAGSVAEFRIPLFYWALYAAGQFKDAPERIDHSLPPTKAVAEGANAEYGAYVANLCIGCHGANLAGTEDRDGPPALSPDSEALKRYDTVEKFKTMFRTGKAPDGRAIRVMPFEALGKFNDTDVEALYLYLKSRPAKSLGAK
jgi:mono/diheme cytochrome c family protein